ncbi:hypothetical protein RJG79_07980 [Mycoplasmatota bacterium WC44]
MMKKSNISSYKYFFLGVLMFLVLGMDLFVMPIDILLFGNKFSYETFFESSWYILVTHWSIVIAIWIVAVLLIFKWFKRKDVHEDVILIGKVKDTKKLILIAVIASVMFTILYSVLFFEQIPQFYREYQSFYLYHGNRAIIVSIFQNIYYFVESMIVVLLLALMHRAGELWFNSHKYPYGGIGLLLTWGLGHLTKGIDATLWISGFCIVLGFLFLKANKRWWPSIIFVWLFFLI